VPGKRLRRCTSRSLSYRSSAAVRSLPKLRFLESFREPPPVAWKQSFKERAPKPELGCQRNPLPLTGAREQNRRGAIGRFG